MEREKQIPPMEPLAPIVDQLREIARDELPAPRTCHAKLWDDGTFEAYVYHSPSKEEREWVRYERTTSEIVYEYVKSGGCEEHEFADGETLHVPVHDECEVRVITTVEPPYRPE